jgi:hypothetical protein
MRRRIVPVLPLSINYASRQAFGLAFCAPMAEGGNVLYDITKRQGALASNGGPARGVDQWGNRTVVFDGTDDMFTGNPAPVAFQQTDAFSITFWLLTTTSSNGMIISTWDQGVASGWGAFVAAAGGLVFCLNNTNGSSQRFVTSNTTV